MKDLITAVASLMLLLIFVLQFAGNQNLHTRMFRADMAIENFRDVVGMQGYISDENRGLLSESLAGICGCSPEEILVEAEDSRQPKPEGTLVHYRVGYPLKDLVAAASMLGISPEENCVWMEDEGWVVSRLYISEEPQMPEEENAA
ncbi:MAG: hypothetical protein ACI4WY_00450 [Anaerovoracaceae bacterium]